MSKYPEAKEDGWALQLVSYDDHAQLVRHLTHQGFSDEEVFSFVAKNPHPAGPSDEVDRLLVERAFENLGTARVRWVKPV